MNIQFTINQIIYVLKRVNSAKNGRTYLYTRITLHISKRKKTQELIFDN